MTEPLSIAKRGAALVVEIHRPERRNALSRDTLRALSRVPAKLAEDATLRAVILTGAGEQAFCAGADLQERRAMSPDDIREQLQAYRTELGWIDRCPLPVIAAINGVALGGGLEIALMCDLRVAAAHAELALPETRLGIIPGAGGTQRLPRLIGESRAKEMILLGRRVTAREALAWGLLHRIAEPNVSLVDDVLGWIRPILEGAPLAQAAALDAIDGAAELPLGRGLQRELALYERCLLSEDRVEALAALADKRSPKFQGR